MTVYSINDIEALTGVKAHTIRIWEKRYNLINPKRTETNIRYYEDEDLKKLLNIALLNRNGFKISVIAKMTPEEMMDKVATLTEVDIDYDDQIDTLTLSMIELDENKFNRIIDKHIQEKGFENTLFEIVFPLLDKVSGMWMSGSFKRVHEYFLSFMIRRKIVAAIENIKDEDCKSNGKRVLIFLLNESIFGLSFILAHFLLRKRGFKVTNIGNSVLPQDILDAANLCKPDYLFTFYDVQGTVKEFDSMLNSLIGHGIHIPVLVAGAPVGQIDENKYENVNYLGSLDQTLTYFDFVSQVQE